MALGGKENYEKSTEEYDLAKKFNDLSKARDLQVNMILSNKEKVDPFKLKTYKEKVDIYSKQMMDLVGKNKDKKLDPTQTKYYEELKNKTIEKKIADKRFDNLWDFLSKNLVGKDNRIIGITSTLNLTDKVKKPYDKEISVQGIKIADQPNNFKDYTDYYYSIKKDKNGSYFLVSGFGKSNYNPKKVEAIPVETVELNVDQVNENLDKIVTKIEKIKGSEKKESEKKQKNQQKVKDALDLSQLEQKIDQAYMS